MATAAGSANQKQLYEEIEYTETANEFKATEDLGDPQTTERIGQDKVASKLKDTTYDSRYEGDDGDTERRHFSSLPGN